MKFILINKVNVIYANAVSGFTADFSSITHFLGYVHNLQRKLNNSELLDLKLTGCAVVCHEHYMHKFKNSNGTIKFIQSKNPRYMYGDNKATPAPIIEEGKLNFTVSLLIAYDGNVGNEDMLVSWMQKQCVLQKLAGGSIQSVGSIDLFAIDKDDEDTLRSLRHKLMPGFILYNRHDLLENHINSLKTNNSYSTVLDAWIDFVSLKQRARPKHKSIDSYLDACNEISPAIKHAWNEHLGKIYDIATIPNEIINHFKSLKRSKEVADVLSEWHNYISPTQKTDATWSYLPKPFPGYLVPIMVGYKAISNVMNNEEVLNVRDNKTPVCFVEAVHTIGEWRGVHRLKTLEDVISSLWQYECQKNWYLCQQNLTLSKQINPSKYL